MDRFIVHESQLLTQPPSSPVSSSSGNGNGFPVLAIAVLGIMAATFLLVSYYIFVTKCCFSWPQLDPLRRFSFRRTRPADDFLMAYSPSVVHRRGLDEMLIREIPTFQYHKTEGEEGSKLFKCVVCLTEFQDQDMLRLLPKCSHAFHLDCIDVWLQNNANCPLCRTSISGANRDHHHHPLDAITAPNSSPQDPQPFVTRLMGGYDEDFVVIEVSTAEEGNRTLLQRQQERSDSSRQLKLTRLKPRKSHHASIMGDECINVREKDDQFSIQPIRRSFSMDSAVDRHVFLSVQEILRQNRNLAGIKNSDQECSSRSQRSIFSFGQGRGSKRAVLPVDQL